MAADPITIEDDLSSSYDSDLDRFSIISMWQEVLGDTFVKPASLSCLGKVIL